MTLSTAIAYPDKLNKINPDNISLIIDKKYSDVPIPLYPLCI